MIKYKQKKYNRHKRICRRRQIKQNWLQEPAFIKQLMHNYAILKNSDITIGGTITSVTITRGKSNETWSRTTLNGEEI